MLPDMDTGREFNILHYASQSAAMAALDAQEIQAYYVFQPDYLDNRRAELVYREQPDSDATRYFYDFLQLNLLLEVPPEIAWRAADGPAITIRNPLGTRSFPSGAPTLGSVLPILFGVSIGGLLLLGAGSLMTGLLDEKSNRTMEVIATSISSSRMIIGKLFGILTVSLFQLAFWIVIGALAIWIAGSVFSIAWFGNPTVDWPSMLAIVAVALPSFVDKAGFIEAIPEDVPAGMLISFSDEE